MLAREATQLGRVGGTDPAETGPQQSTRDGFVPTSLRLRGRDAGKDARDDGSWHFDGEVSPLRTCLSAFWRGADSLKQGEWTSRLYCVPDEGMGALG